MTPTIVTSVYPRVFANASDDPEVTVAYPGVLLILSPANAELLAAELLREAKRALAAYEQAQEQKP